MKHVTTAALVVLATSFIVGCGGGTYPVNGKVVWKDGAAAKELAGSQIVFEMPEKGTSSRGVIQADGTFKLTSLETDDGAPAGDHKVFIVENRKNANAAGTLLMPSVLHERYGSIDTSGLNWTVKAGANDDVIVTVERARSQ